MLSFLVCIASYVVNCPWLCSDAQELRFFLISNYIKHFEKDFFLNLQLSRSGRRMYYEVED